VHLRAAFHVLGAGYARVVRVSGKPLRDEQVVDKPSVIELGTQDALGSANDRSDFGTRGPLRLMTDVVDGNTVVTMPDPRSRFVLEWKPTGFSLAKR
jgi:hypothetical protein